MTEQIFEGQVAIVTGGGRGLGRAMTLGLARAGARVIVTASREANELDQVAAQARTECGTERVYPIVADVTRQSDCEQVVAAALQYGQRLIADRWDLQNPESAMEDSGWQ